MRLTPAIRKLRSFERRIRQARMTARMIQRRRYPVLAHVIPTRRCNLSCAYCNEYDKVSSPVPTAEMLRRIDLLAAFGTGIITFSGGEPLLHPDLDEMIRRIRSHGAVATLITNGYLLSKERIERLNRAGLDQLQISIDNVEPDEISKKSLKVLDKKLQLLADFAEFEVNINTVIGAGIKNAGDALTIARRARELKFDTSVGIVHDHSGQVQPLRDEERAVYDQIQAEKKPGFMAFAYDSLFHKNLAQGQPNDWRCRAGSRYLYICENGLVHYCSQQRGFPAIPLEKYGREDLEREYWTRKPCAPFCTISCVHRVAMIDLIKDDPRGALTKFFPPAAPGEPPRLPMGVGFLAQLFLPPEDGKPQGPVVKAVAAGVSRLFGIK